MKQQQTNLLGEALDIMKHTWRHREGVRIGKKEIATLRIGKLSIELENKAPAAILDTIDALWPEPKPRPLLTHQKRTPTGWHMIFTLMPGISYQDVIKKQEYFNDACRLPVVILKRGGYVHMHVYTDTLGNAYPFEWDPAKYPKMYLPVPIGYSQEKLEVLDPCEAPHMLVAGVTGFGKSVFIHGLIHALLPVAKVAIIDMKRLQFNHGTTRSTGGLISAL